MYQNKFYSNYQWCFVTFVKRLENSDSDNGVDVFLRSESTHYSSDNRSSENENDLNDQTVQQFLNLTVDERD